MPRAVINAGVRVFDFDHISSAGCLYIDLEFGVTRITNMGFHP